MTSPSASSSMASTATRQQIVQVVSVDPTTSIAVGQTAQGQQLTINTRYMVGAVHYTPGVGEQWYVKQVGTVTWALDRKLPKNTNDLANVADNPVPGQVQIGSSGIVSGPLNLMGSQINAQAPISLQSVSTTSLPSASTAGAGAVIYNSTTSQPMVSDGTQWNPLSTTSSSTTNGNGNNGGGTTTSVTWEDITDVPSTFPSDWSDITNIPADFPTSWEDITGLPLTFPPTLPSGTPTPTTYWCGDGTWKTPPAGGGQVELTVGVIPSGTIDGSNTVFNLPAFVLSSTMVYLNGLRLVLDGDYEETDNITITLTQAPELGDKLSVDYVASGGVNSVAEAYTVSVGDGASTTFTLTHNFDTRNILIALYDASTYEEVNCDKFRTSLNEVTLTFDTAPAANAYVAVLIAASTQENPISDMGMVIGEAPVGDLNGFNTVFTTTQTYITASTSVFRNGLREQINVGYSESTNDSISFTTPPLSTDIVLIDYMIAA